MWDDRLSQYIPDYWYVRPDAMAGKVNLEIRGLPIFGKRSEVSEGVSLREHSTILNGTGL